MRKLPSWVDGFVEYTKPRGSPEIFCRWAALTLIGAAMEQKTWVTNDKGVLYPNLYTMLVGPPGGGKTLAFNAASRMYTTLKTHHISSSNVSRASLIDDLAAANRSVMVRGVAQAFNSIFILSDELSVFMPAYDSDFLAALNQIYSGEMWSERKRGKDLHFQIKRPQMSMLSGTQPAFLAQLLPEAAWDQGFMSRTIMIFSDEEEPTPLWGGFDPANGLWDELVADLKTIGDLYGEFTFSEEAAEAVNKWHMTYGPPRPTHPRLQHYNSRRIGHLLKLCMIVSASQSDELLITLSHYREALGWLIDAEHFMEDLFKAMNKGGDSSVMRECWDYCYKENLKTKNAGVPEGKIVGFVTDRVPNHSVMRVIDLMVKRGWLDKQPKKGIGYVYFAKELRE